VPNASVGIGDKQLAGARNITDAESQVSGKAEGLAKRDPVGNELHLILRINDRRGTNGSRGEDLERM